MTSLFIEFQKADAEHRIFEVRRSLLEKLSHNEQARDLAEQLTQQYDNSKMSYVIGLRNLASHYEQEYERIKGNEPRT